MHEFSGFIGSCARTQERNSSSELYYLLTEILDCNDVSVSPITAIAGLTLTSFDEDPLIVIDRVHKEIEEDNSVLQYTLKLVPIQHRIHSSLEGLKEFSLFFAEQIQEDDTWKINLRRRHSVLEREDIITTLASEITKGKVSLENPKYHLIVEVVGKWTYLALSPIPELALSKYIDLENLDDFRF
ncbi:MAG: THUMP domain-containing protein [Candidatus Heimdallarchaeaceae archaeon]